MIVYPSDRCGSAVLMCLHVTRIHVNTAVSAFLVRNSTSTTLFPVHVAGCLVGKMWSALALLAIASKVGDCLEKQTCSSSINRSDQNGRRSCWRLSASSIIKNGCPI